MQMQRRFTLIEKSFGEPSPDQYRRAARTLLGNARDVEDARDLLAALGLSELVEDLRDETSQGVTYVPESQENAREGDSGANKAIRCEGHPDL